MDSLSVLREIAPKGKAAIIDPVAAALDKYLPQYDITGELRTAHFLAQAAEESDGFHTLQEYASGRAYEGRKDLGNVRIGDGVRFKGRGIFQCTGRTNYEAYGRKLGLDLIARPEMAADPEISVRIACEYWKAKGLNAWADRDDVKEITRRINGGYNGLAARKAYLAKAKAAVQEPEDDPVSLAGIPIEEVPDAPIAAVRAKTGVTEGGTLLGGVQAVDALSQANDVLTKVSETKEQAAKLGLLDHVGALFQDPHFLGSIVALVVIVGALLWWQGHKNQ